MIRVLYMGLLAIHWHMVNSISFTYYAVIFILFSFRIWTFPGNNTVYSVSFCNQISNCNGASVCKTERSSTNRVNLGKKDQSTLTAPANDQSGFSVIYKNGEKCILDQKKSYSSEIYFICGQTLVCSFFRIYNFLVIFIGF